MGVIKEYHFEDGTTVIVRDDFVERDPVKRQKRLDAVWRIIQSSRERVERERIEKEEAEKKKAAAIGAKGEQENGSNERAAC